MKRVEAIGAYAVRREDWGSVRFVALRRSQSEDFAPYRSWLRHGLTMANRAEVFKEEKEVPGEGLILVETRLVSLVRRLVDTEGCMRPDCVAGEERTLNSILQFDLLAAFAAMSDAGTTDAFGVWFPNFAFWHSWRLHSVAKRLINDRAMREQIATERTSNEFLAEALASVDDAAKSITRGLGVWDGWLDHEIQRFIDAHVPRA